MEAVASVFLRAEVADCWEATEVVWSAFRIADPDQAAGRLDHALSWCEAPEMQRLAPVAGLSDPGEGWGGGIE